jgi:hypothetical protein
MGLVREVTTQGVGWASEEVSDLVAPPSNLVLYIHLRIFAYTSNALIASFEYMDVILAGPRLNTSCISSGQDLISTGFRYSEKRHVLAKVPFVYRPCASDEADLFYLPVLTLYHRTDSASEGGVLILALTRYCS